MRPAGPSPYAFERLSERAVVTLHGFLGAPSMWDDELEDLVVDVVAGRLPGHGLDPWLPVVATFEGVADALVGALPAGSAPWLLAYSMGARVALGMLVRHPGRFAGAVLVGVHPGLPDETERRARAALDDERAASLAKDGLAAFVAAWEAEPLFASQGCLPTDVLQRQRAVRRAHDARALGAALGALGLGRMPSLGPALGTCGAPIVVVTGALDEKFDRIAAELAERNATVEHVRVPGVGHNVVLEAPGAVAALLGSRMGLDRSGAPRARSRDGLR